MYHQLAFRFIFLLVLFLSACNNSPKSESNSTESSFSSPPLYSEIHQNIIQPRCLSCHSSGTYNFSNYNNLIASGVVSSGNPNSSTFYTSVQTGRMPRNSSVLSNTSIQAIYEWIQSGANN